MKNKFYAILFLYLIQFVCTACDPCSCPAPKTYEITYDIIRVKGWDTSRFQNEEVTDTVHKNAFGLSISLDYKRKQIADNSTSLKISSLGFTGAMACSCAEDKYLDTDPTESIEIVITDPQTLLKEDVTNNFTVNDYQGKKVLITDFFKNNSNYNFNSFFQADLTDYKSIPNSVTFTINVYLKSGVVLTQKTSKFQFFN